MVSVLEKPRVAAVPCCELDAVKVVRASALNCPERTFRFWRPQMLRMLTETMRFPGRGA